MCVYTYILNDSLQNMIFEILNILKEQIFFQTFEKFCTI